VVPSPYSAVGPKPRQAPFWGALISLRKFQVSCLSCVLFHLPWAANLTPSVPLFLSLLSLLSSPSLLREEPPGCNGPLRRARFAACKSFINGRYLYHNWEKTTSLSEGTWKRGEGCVGQACQVQTRSRGMQTDESRFPLPHPPEPRAVPSIPHVCVPDCIPLHRSGSPRSPRCTGRIKNWCPPHSLGR
jgi:hypothetical protein